MKNVLATAKKIAAAVLPILALLKQPGVATAVVGVLAPIIAGIAGANFDATVLVPYLVLVGSAAGGLQKAVTGSVVPQKPAPAPAPPAK